MYSTSSRLETVVRFLITCTRPFRSRSFSSWQQCVAKNKYACECNTTSETHCSVFTPPGRARPDFERDDDVRSVDIIYTVAMPWSNKNGLLFRSPEGRAGTRAPHTSVRPPSGRRVLETWTRAPADMIPTACTKTVLRWYAIERTSDRTVARKRFGPTRRSRKWRWRKDDGVSSEHRRQWQWRAERRDRIAHTRTDGHDVECGQYIIIYVCIYYVLIVINIAVRVPQESNTSRILTRGPSDFQRRFNQQQLFLCWPRLDIVLPLLSSPSSSLYYTII